MAGQEPEPAGPCWADFADAVSGEYTLTLEVEAFALVLEEAVQLAHSARPGGGFRLLFRGPAEPVLEQATYSLAGAGGAHDIFLVPVGRDARGVAYEAIFN